MNDLYHNELRLYKNFFQPVMKLASKERVGGSIKRRYEVARTPYQRLMESHQTSETVRQELEAVYRSLNPAELKRNIDAKLDRLYEVYEEKKGSPQVNPHKEVTPRRVTYYVMQQPPVGLPA